MSQLPAKQCLVALSGCGRARRFSERAFGGSRGVRLQSLTVFGQSLSDMLRCGAKTTGSSIHCFNIFLVGFMCPETARSWDHESIDVDVGSHGVWERARDFHVSHSRKRMQVLILPFRFRQRFGGMGGIECRESHCNGKQHAD